MRSNVCSEWLFQPLPETSLLTVDRGSVQFPPAVLPQIAGPFFLFLFFQSVTKQDFLSMSSAWHPTFWTEGIMGCDQREGGRGAGGGPPPPYDPGDYQSNCNFKHALFSEAVRSVRLPDYLHFEKPWQGNCRHVLQSPEVISQRSQRYQNVWKTQVRSVGILFRSCQTIIALKASR